MNIHIGNLSIVTYSEELRSSDWPKPLNEICIFEVCWFDWSLEFRRVGKQLDEGTCVRGSIPHITMETLDGLPLTPEMKESILRGENWVKDG